MIAALGDNAFTAMIIAGVWMLPRGTKSTPDMRKVAREVRRIARGRECDLLDVGCGPGTLARLMPPGVRYHVDITIPAPVPNLIEMDIIEEPVGFRGQTFDVCAARWRIRQNYEYRAAGSMVTLVYRDPGRRPQPTGYRLGGYAGGAREQGYFRNAYRSLFYPRGMQQPARGTCRRSTLVRRIQIGYEYPRVPGEHRG